MPLPGLQALPVFFSSPWLFLLNLLSVSALPPYLLVVKSLIELLSVFFEELILAYGIMYHLNVATPKFKTPA